MRRTIREAHHRMLGESPALYAAVVFAIATSVLLALLGHERAALCVFIIGGLTGLQMARYKG